MDDFKSLMKLFVIAGFGVGSAVALAIIPIALVVFTLDRFVGSGCVTP